MANGHGHPVKAHPKRLHWKAMQELKMVSAAVRSKKVRVCIVGVGNCASSFVQGLTFYRRAQTNEPAPGLMNVDVGGYQVGDVEISAAFDISANKVGRDVSEAIFAQPNNTFRFDQYLLQEFTFAAGQRSMGSADIFARTLSS